MKNEELNKLLYTVTEATKKLELYQENRDTHIEALKLKRSILADWNDALNRRRRAYWNFIMNRNKGRLYKTWQQNDPQFLPMKFRPKIQETDSPQIQDLRLQEAFDKYKRNIKELKLFEDKHSETFKNVDEEIMAKIDKSTSATGKYDLLKEELKQMWHSETSDQEHRSIEIWNKKERFLIRKKYEEMKNGSENKQKTCRLKEKTEWVPGTNKSTPHNTAQKDSPTAVGETS